VGSSGVDERERRLGLLAAISCALLWGVLAIVMKVASAEVGPVTIVWFRFTFAFTGLAGLFLVREPRALGVLLRPPRLALLAAFALTVNYLGFMQGLAMTTPSVAQILIQTGPLLLAVAGVVLFGERLGPAQVVGGLLALLGFGVFYADQQGAAVVPGAVLLDGVGFLLLGAVAWATYAVLQKRVVARGLGPQRLNLVLYALPTLALFGPAELGSLAALDAVGWAIMVFLGANTLLAYGALGEALKRLPAYQVSLIITANPLITLGVMELLRRSDPPWLPADRVGPTGLAGALLVLLGLAAVLRRTPGRRES
jgi:drug/metabolite transporter (DMT)-like permease